MYAYFEVWANFLNRNSVIEISRVVRINSEYTLISEIFSFINLLIRYNILSFLIQSLQKRFESTSNDIIFIFRILKIMYFK